MEIKETPVGAFFNCVLNLVEIDPGAIPDQNVSAALRDGHKYQNGPKMFSATRLLCQSKDKDTTVQLDISRDCFEDLKVKVGASLRLCFAERYSETLMKSGRFVYAAKMDVLSFKSQKGRLDVHMAAGGLQCFLTLAAQQEGSTIAEFKQCVVMLASSVTVADTAQ